MGMTKNKTLKEVQKLFDMYFQANSLLDSASYFLDIDCIMPRFADFIHEHMAHAMPLIADQISDFARLRGDKLHRGGLEARLSNFDSAYTCMYDIFKYFINIEEQIDIATNTAKTEDMKMWEDFLRELQISKQSAFTHQASVFLKAIKAYERDGILSSFNKDFKSYIAV